MTREQMMDKVIVTIGMENYWTVWFCELAEAPEIPDDMLLSIMETLLKSY
jgi:hypothetical protein